MLKQYRLKDYRFRLVFYVVALTIIGIMVVGSAKPSVQNKQIAGLILGLIVMVGVSLIDYNFILKFSWIFYFINVALLAAIFVIGEKTKGARRWLKLGIRFQPSELGKILLVLFFAYYLSKNKDKLNNIRTLFCTLVLAAVPLLLIFKEPDLSTTIVTALIFASLLFIAGLSYKIVLGVLAVAVPSLVVVLTLVLQPGQKLLTGNQALRILGWLEPDKYPNIAYQQQNSIMAVGSGQLWGKGLNNTNIVSVISYYDNTSRLAAPLGYVDATNNCAVKINPNKWLNEYGYANGVMIGQMTFVTDGNSGGVSSGSSMFPLAIWFDTKFQ